MTNEKTTTGKAPDLIAYTVQSRGEDQSAIWTRLGAGWKHKDGKGYDVVCQALPTDGRLTFRFQEKSGGAQSQDQQQISLIPEIK